jgi:hypothetical protein
MGQLTILKMPFPRNVQIDFARSDAVKRRPMIGCWKSS